MGFQVKAWLRRKTVMLVGSKGWQEREGEICAIASSRVARRGAARTQASKPALASLTREGSARHGVSRPGAAPLGQAAQG